MSDEKASARLRAIREAAGLSVRELADRLGVSLSTYSHHEYRSKKTYLPLEFAQKVADALQDKDVRREDVLALAGVVPEKVTVPAAFKQIPVYSVAASAGPGVYVDREEIVDQISFPIGYLSTITRTSPSKLAIISVKGNSMVPTLAHEDVVMLDMTKTHLGFDGLFVLAIDDVLHVKRVTRAPEPGKVLIVSDNRAEYPPFQRDMEDVRVVGKVVWKGQRT